MSPVRAHQVLAPAAVAAVVGAALLVGHDRGTGARPGDGGPTSPPTTVSPQEFCAGFGDLAQARQDLLAGTTPEGVRRLRDAAAQVGRLADGTTLSADARAGVDFVVAALLGLEDDAAVEDVVAADERATLRDDRHASALSDFIGRQC